jgi:hypothetical protein
MKLMNTSKALTQKSNTLTQNAPKAMQLGNLTIKQVMIADLGDGAFTDQSIKIKPNKKGPGVVLKCTDRKRLVAGLAQAGIDAGMVQIKRGGKHWIAIVGIPGVGSALVKA